jgi:hypothetical protein
MMIVFGVVDCADANVAMTTKASTTSFFIALPFVKSDDAEASYSVPPVVFVHNTQAHLCSRVECAKAHTAQRGVQKIMGTRGVNPCRWSQLRSRKRGMLLGRWIREL